METIEIACPNCGNTFWYWTINNHIVCQQCNTGIPVTPCVPEETTDTLEDGGDTGATTI
jgi:DNA-directed RNA polymerase subunit RPC12/RpoP